MKTVVYGKTPANHALCNVLSQRIQQGNRNDPRFISVSYLLPPAPPASSSDSSSSGLEAETPKILEAPATPKIHKTPRPHSKKSTQVKINPMDQDVSRRRLRQLYTWVDQSQSDYITNLIDPDCNEASAVALKKERDSFYRLFGAKPSEQEALAKLIADDVDSHNSKSAQIVDGLINYLKSLANFIQNRKTQLEQKAPKLLQRYIKFGVHEVYRLIKSIALKITTAGHSNIDPHGDLFPTVHKSIIDIFGNVMKPIEF